MKCKQYNIIATFIFHYIPLQFISIRIDDIIRLCKLKGLFF